VFYKFHYTDKNVKPIYLSKLPIPNISIEQQQPFIAKADLMLSFNKELQEISGKFQRTIQRKFDLEELPARLQNWYQLTYSEFIKELGKRKIKLSLSDEAEWETYFVQEIDKVHSIKNKLMRPTAKLTNDVCTVWIDKRRN